MSLSKQDNTLLILVSCVVASSVVTYATTQFLQNKRELRRLKSEYYEKSQVRQQQASKQKERGEPMGTLIDDVKIDHVYLWEVEHLSHRFPSSFKGAANTMATGGSELPSRGGLERGDPAKAAFFQTMSSSFDLKASIHKKKTATPYNKLIEGHECVLSDLVRKPRSAAGVMAGDKHTTCAYIRAGPRKKLHFDPSKVNAAIVTCGGLCPGLNNVVREITNTLFQLYGVEGTVWGVRGGYKGFHKDSTMKPIRLTPGMVSDIHHEGGTVLCSSRGGFDLEKIIAFLQDNKISQLYVIGGDGTHRGAFAVHEGCMARGLNVSVAGIPKTIDNDVDYIDRSFGFSSAIEAAQGAIRSAKTEATCNLPNGIGIVKLMGRSSGFIAAHATMASGDVDLCLVPEVPIVLEGENGCLPHLMRRVKSQGFAVVVVAEGAGEELLGTSAQTDASGNKKLPKIGEFMKQKIEEHFAKNGKTATVKYIDPSYMIRSIPANAADSLYCMQLAQNAVHGAMAGFTGFSVGLCNNRMVFLPIPELCSTSPRLMDPWGRTWERVLAVTRQPNTVPKGAKPKYSSHEPTLR